LEEDDAVGTGAGPRFDGVGARFLGVKLVEGDIIGAGRELEFESALLLEPASLRKPSAGMTGVDEVGAGLTLGGGAGVRSLVFSLLLATGVLNLALGIRKRSERGWSAP
jgi:hypothetical protein